MHPAFDNQRLGFPPNRSMEMLYYNQTWLEELGFDGPPATPEEFQARWLAPRAEANGDGYRWLHPARRRFGGGLVDLCLWRRHPHRRRHRATCINSPATVEAMTFLKGMYDEGCAYFFTEGFPNTEFAARHALFAQGSSSGIPFYENDIVTIAGKQGREPDVWGVAAIPHTTADPVQNVYGGDVMIPRHHAGSKNWPRGIFVKWFTYARNPGRVGRSQRLLPDSCQHG